MKNPKNKNESKTLPTPSKKEIKLINGVKEFLLNTVLIILSIHT